MTKPLTRNFFLAPLIFVLLVLLLQVFCAHSASAATRTTLPGVPRDVRAISGINSATLNFIAPDSNGGSRILWYYVRVFGTNSPTYKCDTTRCPIVGLRSNFSYRFIVSAVNKYGHGTYSGPSNAVIPHQPATTTVTFNANGGSGTMSSETEPNGSTARLTLNSFTYTGHTYTGWNTAANGSGTGFTNGELVKFDGNVTLYAQWSESAITTATITFIANGGIGTMAPETETLNVSATLTLNAFTRSGYSFIGWNTEANGSGTSFTNGELVEFSYSATFYAQWTSSVIVPSENQSSNWSGYVLPTTSLDTEVTGQWTVPTLYCVDTPNGSSATWVGSGGITWSDGTSSGALLQTGIEDDCVDGVQEDAGWWEIVPANPNNEETFSDFPVSPGDSILAEVYPATSGQWVTVVQDLTTGLQGVMETGDSWYVSTIANNTLVGGIQGNASGYSYSGAYSVEWIEEDVTNAGSGSLFAFPNFGSVTFLNLRTSILTGWSLSADDAYEIVDGNGDVVSVPSAVTNDGFTVTYIGP